MTNIISFQPQNGGYSNFTYSRDDWAQKREKIEVIIPTLNEEDTIGHVIEKVIPFASKIVVIDGGSVDNTLKVISNYDVDILIQNGRGKGAALREAFSNVDKDLIIILDADGSMVPSEIPHFIYALDNGADVAKGSRFMKNGGSHDISLFRRFGNYGFVFLVNLFFGLKLTDLCYGYMAFTNHAIKKMNVKLNSTDFDIETEMVLKAEKLGLNVVEVPSVERKRFYGRSKLNWFKDGLKILRIILMERFQS